MVLKERLEYIRNWQRNNKDKRKVVQKRYREHHKDCDKIKYFLYGHRIRIKRGQWEGRKYRSGIGLLHGDGCCLFCGDFNPFHLENHHPFGILSEFTITLCSNCHSEIHRLGIQDYIRECFV